MNISIGIEPYFRDDRAFLFQSFSFENWKFPSTRAMNSCQVHFFPPIISFSQACAKVLVSSPTILDSTAQILAAPAKAVEFSSCHVQTHVHHSLNFLPLEPSYVPGSVKILESLGACAPQVGLMTLALLGPLPNFGSLHSACHLLGLVQL